MSPFRQYLDRYAEPIVHEFEAQIRRKLHRTYQSVLVIPLYDEPPECINHVLPPDIHDTLVIGVVNAAADQDREAIQRTQDCLSRLGNENSLFTVVPRTADTTLLVVDCCTPGRQMPPKQGVGLARKIGADLALTCIENHIVERPWIYCTDADAVLPSGYFDPMILDETVAVALYPFTHHPPHDNILRYEIWLRYYTTQLAFAGSPYAFHTIGSLLKINAQHYAKVRGFPKRKAAEDFYMLNKLAKVGQVVRLKRPCILLSSRLSTRVPFGTGATMKRLGANPELLFYDPEIFNLLRHWLGLTEQLWRDRDAIQLSSLRHWWRSQRLADDIWLEILLQLGLDRRLLDAYRQCQDYRHFQYFIWVWFDAFRTLKFIHYLRDRSFPSLPLETAIGSASVICHGEETVEPSTTLASLQQINQKLIAAEAQLSAKTGPTLCLD